MKKYLAEFNRVMKQCKIDPGDIRMIRGRLKHLKTTGGTLYLVGNGGSNAIVSHAAVDIVNKYHIKVMPLTDASMLTMAANDSGRDHMFSDLLLDMATKDDMLIAVSSSGESQNIINAAKAMISKTAFVVTLSGFHEFNQLRSLVDFWINSTNYGIVETGHALILHYLTEDTK